MCFLSNHADHSHISKCERGKRAVSIRLVLVYHILFEVSVEDLFLHQKQATAKELAERIDLLLTELNQQEKLERTAKKIDFLQNILTRLTTH